MVGKTVNVGIRLPVEIKEQVNQIAQQEDRSFSYQVISLLRAALEQREKQVPPSIGG